MAGQIHGHGPVPAGQARHLRRPVMPVAGEAVHEDEGRRALTDNFGFYPHAVDGVRHRASIHSRNTASLSASSGRPANRTAPGLFVSLAKTLGESTEPSSGSATEV
jgi:hypothetical protein